MKVTLLGLGGGAVGTWTEDARLALERAEAVFGAPRLLAGLPDFGGQRRIAATRPREILDALLNLNCERTAVAYSGDTGFYSGARLLLPLLREQGIEAEVLPGLSSVQLLSARLGRPWQDWKLISAHGLDCDAVEAVMAGKAVFFLTGGALGPAALCGQLAAAGLGNLPVTVGENLAAPEERVVSGTAAEFAAEKFAPLSVLLAEAAPTMPRRTPGWPDGWFLRGAVPMTKQEVRAAALSKLAVAPGETCWDVGAGTGSVSVELAALCSHVYAVECEAEACELTRQNREKFHAWNLTVVEGRAPEALNDLPAPDAVFLGGTKGALAPIVDAALAKNPKARLCISAIALETLSAAIRTLKERGIEAEITQLAVSRTRPAGSLHLLTANNPIFLITGNCP